MKTIQIAKRLNAFPEYIFSRLAKTIIEVENKSKRNVLNLSIGTPDIPPSGQYINKFIEFIQSADAHLYPGYGASEDFSNSLIDWYKKRFNLLITNEELLPLLGAKDGISHLPLALLNKGDEVLIPNPGYPAFTGPVLIIDAQPVYYDLLETNNFKINFINLKRKTSNKTKFIWINFPSNPTGQVTTFNELKDIVKFAKQNNIFIVYDNAYSEITFNDFIAPSILQIDGAKDVAVEIGSFSKTFSFAGFRMGWIVGNKAIIAALAKIKSQMDSGLSLPLQHLGAFALSHYDENWHNQSIAIYEKRREIISTKLKKLGLTFSLPIGAFYIWARIPSSAKNSEDYCMDLLKQKQVLLTPGTAFGSNGDRFVRVSICVNINKIDEYI